jgi:hypothetical protein
MRSTVTICCATKTDGLSAAAFIFNSSLMFLKLIGGLKASKVIPKLCSVVLRDYQNVCCPWWLISIRTENRRPLFIWKRRKVILSHIKHASGVLVQKRRIMVVAALTPSYVILASARLYIFGISWSFLWVWYNLEPSKSCTLKFCHL